jgi:hypothetical protein
MHAHVRQGRDAQAHAVTDPQDAHVDAAPDHHSVAAFSREDQQGAMVPADAPFANRAHGSRWRRSGGAVMAETGGALMFNLARSA